MSEEAELTAAFEELETGPVEAPVEATETDLAQELEDELKHMSVSADDSEEEEEPDDQTDDCDLEVRLRQQIKANVLLIERCDKFDGYIKQLIQMVETLGGRLKHFGLDDLFLHE
jgi:hypothetical protein